MYGNHCLGSRTLLKDSLQQRIITARPCQTIFYVVMYSIAPKLACPMSKSFTHCKHVDHKNKKGDAAQPSLKIILKRF